MFEEALEKEELEHKFIDGELDSREDEEEILKEAEIFYPVVVEELIKTVASSHTINILPELLETDLASISEEAVEASKYLKRQLEKIENILTKCVYYKSVLVKHGRQVYGYITNEFIMQALVFNAKSCAIDTANFESGDSLVRKLVDKYLV